MGRQGSQAKGPSSRTVNKSFTPLEPQLCKKMVILDKKGCSTSGIHTARHKQRPHHVWASVTQDVRHSRKVHVRLHVDEILWIRLCRNIV